MHAPATKPTGSADTTDEPVPHCTITEKLYEKFTATGYILECKGAQKNTHGN
jgi:hypothetical protein